jgi:hypothetical protein
MTVKPELISQMNPSLQTIKGVCHEVEILMVLAVSGYWHRFLFGRHRGFIAVGGSA